MTTLGVIREQEAGETRVAVVPDTVARLRSADIEVLVETGAGAAAWFPDEIYEKAGARVVSRGELYDDADIVGCVAPPRVADRLAPRGGQTLVGLLDPLHHLDRVRAWAERHVTAVSLDLLPRTLSRAQTMDALSSQASIAGYKAVLVAANTLGRYFPMLTTAAGTTTPARVLVLGAGVAGLAAIATARRLGAVVLAYDVRPQARGEIESLGARFVEVAGVESGAGAGGYARQLTEVEQATLRQELDHQVAQSDVVITTAQVPGARPPVLVSTGALEQMTAGAVVVDLAAGVLGGNVAGSRPGQTLVRANGVTVIGAGDLPARMPAAASTAYARNLAALLAYLVRDGALRIDLADEIQAGVVVTHGGSVVHPTVAARLAGPAATGAAPSTGA